MAPSRTLVFSFLSGILHAGCSSHGAAVETSRDAQAGDAAASMADAARADSASPNADASPAPSADYYVATDGNDHWSGQLASPNTSGTDGPFATIGGAQAAVRSLRSSDPSRSTPIVVQIRAGEYATLTPLTFSAADSGTKESPVIYEAYPSESPVITGGVHLSKWEMGAEGTETASAVGLRPFSQLWINGARRYRPRTHGGQYLYVAAPVLVTDPLGSGCTAGLKPNQNTCFDRFYFSPGDVAAGMHDLSDVEIDFFGNWTMSRMRVKSVDATHNLLVFTGPVTNDAADEPRGPRVSAAGAVSYRYLVENVQEDLSPGTWYLDMDATGSPSTLSYAPLSGESIADAVAPQAAQLVVATDLANVTFRGLTFAYTNWVVPAQGHASTHAEPDLPAALSFTSSTAVSVDHCILSQLAGYGIEFEGSSTEDTVKNSLLTDLGTGGVRIGTAMRPTDSDDSVPSRVTVSNNVIAHGGRMLPAGLAIDVGNSHHDTVEHNDIFDFYNQAINVGASYQFTDTTNFAHDNTISYNHIYDIGQGVTSDLGAVHHLGLSKLAGDSSSTGTVIAYNRVHDIAANSPATNGYNGTGIYLDQASSSVTVQNNLVYRTSSAGLNTNQVDSNVITNNIFAFSPTTTGGNNGFYSGVFCVTAPSPEEPIPAGIELTFTSNIVYLTASAEVLGMKDDWSMQVSKGTPLSTRFTFDKNLYYDPTATSFTFQGMSLTAWRSQGEDLHSEVEDPGFVCPGNTSPCTGSAADNYDLKSDSPALALGFVSFASEIATAGYQPAHALVAPAVAPAFPSAASP